MAFAVRTRQGLTFEASGRNLAPIAPFTSGDMKQDTPQASEDDPLLIERIARGDRLAMQVLFSRHRVRVFRFLLRYIRDEASAEDVLADVFLDVWRQAGQGLNRA